MENMEDRQLFRKFSDRFAELKKRRSSEIARKDSSASRSHRDQGPPPQKLFAE
eukprot:GSA25T00023306001.1